MASVQTQISQLPTAGAITGDELVPIVQNGLTVQTTTGAISATPSQTQTFLTVNQEPTLPNSRSLSAGSGVTLTDGGAQAALQIGLNGAAASLNSASTGIVAKTASNAVAARSIASGSTGLSVTNGDGVSGNPTVALTGQVLSLANASGAGLLALPNNGTVTPVAITGTSNQISVTNGTGAAGNPTVGLASNPVLPGTGSATLPVGTTAQRSGSAGAVRYNQDIGLFEGYNSSGWTAFASGSGVTSVATGTGLTGGPITSTGTISIANTGVSAATYGSSTQIPVIAVNAQGQITSATNTSIVGTLSYQGGWNATSNTPTLTSSVGTTGYYYVVTTAGTTNLNGITDWQIGDWAIFNGSVWQKIDQTNTVSSVNGQTGVVSIGYADLSGAIPTWAIANGGTGQTTKAAAYNALTPITTTGDLVIGNGANSATRLPIGTNGYVLTSNGTTATWAASTGGVTSFSAGTTGFTPSTGTTGAITLAGTLAAANGGTGQSSYAVGDILYASTTTALSKLADVATGNALISGGVGVAPSYGKIGLTTHVSGTLPVANGGTGASSASITAFNNITGYTASGATGTTSTNLVFSTSPTLTTPNIGAATATSVNIGTLSYTPANALISSQSSVSTYNQIILQNTNTGATASADFIVNNSNSTDSTYYGDFGMNSSGFTGSGAFNQANNVYLTATTADLAIGTTTANAIHFVVNGSATDSMTISSAGNVTIQNGLSGGTF
jgi:hypothetical protein